MDSQIPPVQTTSDLLKILLELQEESKKGILDETKWRKAIILAEIK